MWTVGAVHALHVAFGDGAWRLFNLERFGVHARVYASLRFGRQDFLLGAALNRRTLTPNKRTMLGLSRLAYFAAKAKENWSQNARKTGAEVDAPVSEPPPLVGRSAARAAEVVGVSQSMIERGHRKKIPRVCALEGVVIVSFTVTFILEWRAVLWLPVGPEGVASP